MKKIITAFLVFASLTAHGQTGYLNGNKTGAVTTPLVTHGTITAGEFTSPLVIIDRTVQISDTNFRGLITTPLNHVIPEWEKSSFNYLDSADVSNIMIQKWEETTSWQSINGDYCAVKKFETGMTINASTDSFYCSVSIYNDGDGWWMYDSDNIYSIASEGSEKFMQALQSIIKVMCEIQMKVYHEQLDKQK